MIDKIVLLYGNTCSGKSSIAKQLQCELGCNYVSFGDLKREEIKKQTALGKTIELQLRLGEIITPSIAGEIVFGNLKRGNNIISGFPISTEELKNLKEMIIDTSVLIFVELEVEKKIIEERFFRRGICSVCCFPGIEGQTCPTHKIKLKRRNDCSEEELDFRLSLYKKRIAPFLKDIEAKKEFQHLRVNASNLSKEQICKIIKEFIMNQE